MNSYLLVFIGAGIGGSLRHAVNVGCTRFCGPAFPWGTLTVNVFGLLPDGRHCGVACRQGRRGVEPAYKALPDHRDPGRVHHLLGLSLDAVLLWERGEIGPASAYVVASVLLSIAGLIAGLALVRGISA